MANTPIRPIRIEDELWDRLGEEDQPRSVIIRQLIEQHLQENK